MKYSFQSAFILFLFVLFFCDFALSQQTTNKSSEKTQIAWLKALQNSKNLELFYTKNSGIMLNDTLFIGLDKISQKLQAHGAKQFERYINKGTHQLRENQKFELGEYYAKNGKTYNTIIGWKKNDKWTKEFEVIYEKSYSFNSQINLVSDERKKWEELANQHRPDLIVDKVVSQNGKYFNRGKKYQRNEIARAYSYMNNDKFKIKLESLRIVQIKDNIIFDIGTFDVGEKGLYTLIWKKEDGNWKLLLDFNF